MTIKKNLLQLAPYYRQVIFFGVFTNLLVLAPSWYMLEVYDRVIYSRNTTTLLMLTGLVVFLYLIMEALEWVRKRMLHDAALTLEATLQKQIFSSAFAAKLQAHNFAIQQVFADFKILKESLASSALISLIDIPFVLIFIVAVFFIHPALGYLTLLGLVLQLIIAGMNQSGVHPRMHKANQFALEAQTYFGNVSQKAEVVSAMGMQARLQTRWLEKQQAFLQYQAEASDIAGKNAASSRFLQVMQSSLVLGLGAYLMLDNALPLGAASMIVASILAARVLSPFMQLVGQWRVLSNAQEAYGRLAQLLEKFPPTESSMKLPAPNGEISVENLSYAVPDSTGNKGREPIIKNINLRLQSGEMLLVAGPSASGKSTLAQLLTGLLAPSAGKVRFNGVDAYQWDKSELGPHIGYLAQDIELLDGTLAENICRFGPVDSEQLQAVIELLDLQTLIDSLPQGLDTALGHEGEFLSGGRRQLVGLARAIYGKPAIVILDEPNANLDEAGERALHRMVSTLKQQGTTFVIISHLQGIKTIADHLIILMQGQVVRYGKPDEVMASLQPQSIPRPDKGTAAGARI